LAQVECCGVNGGIVQKDNGMNGRMNLSRKDKEKTGTFGHYFHRK
jgi:hypothetical protein